MVYQQISRARLSRAGKKLVNDGGWHRFRSDARQYYRVVGKVVQRVVLTQSGDEEIFKQIGNLEPLSTRLFRGGFREEITLRRSGNGYVLADILLPTFPEWERIAEVMKQRGMILRAKGDSHLDCVMEMEECAHRALSESLLLLKAFVLALNEWRNDERSGDGDAIKAFFDLLEVTTRITRESVERKAVFTERIRKV